MDAERLRALRLFAGVDENEIATASEAMKTVEVDEGKILAFEGEFAYRFFVIEEGTANVSRRGNEIRQLGPGDFFGEIGILKSERRTASVVASSPMKLLVLMGWNLHDMEEKLPRVLSRINKALEERLAADRQG